MGQPCLMPRCKLPVFSQLYRLCAEIVLAAAARELGQASTSPVSEIGEAADVRPYRHSTPQSQRRIAPGQIES